ncbi:sugar phosphate isomerase/epimerase family protein [Geosporobacter ferrireducens]|uniref:sugar phosphate isomerase/epimerase family protein n=1 Tax=Geosporobacter ferrireducens TaxID=1424294 RepID=UPI00139ED647|nr:sugar phosphate isomerase/epimerase family protein [Geosporobacter ferrireducens]MTI57604.1 sugar phosphate isomerase/epimerase [Geosporobacter ferrireducens]
MKEIYFSSTLMWDASIEEMFQWVIESGFVGVELWAQHFDAREWQLETYKEKAEIYNIKTILHSNSWDLNFASLNKGIRTASLNEIKSSIDLAADLGAKEVTIHPPKETVSEARDVSMELARQGIEALLDYSRRRNVELSLEIMEKLPKELVTDLKSVKEMTGSLYDSFSYTLDIAHCNSIEEFKRSLKEINHISKIHLSNKQGEKLHTKLSEGDFDFYEVFSILENENVTIVIEGLEKGRSFNTLKENISLIQKIKEKLTWG